MGNDLPNSFQFRGHDFLGDAAVGNGRGDFAAQGLRHVINDGLVPLPAKLPGNGNTRRAAADDGDPFAG